MTTKKNWREAYIVHYKWATGRFHTLWLPLINTAEHVGKAGYKTREPRSSGAPITPVSPTSKSQALPLIHHWNATLFTYSPPQRGAGRVQWWDFPPSDNPRLLASIRLPKEGGPCVGLCTNELDALSLTTTLITCYADGSFTVWDVDFCQGAPFITYRSHYTPPNPSSLFNGTRYDMVTAKLHGSIFVLGNAAFNIGIYRICAKSITRVCSLRSFVCDPPLDIYFEPSDSGGVMVHVACVAPLYRQPHEVCVHTVLISEGSCAQIRHYYVSERPIGLTTPWHNPSSGRITSIALMPPFIITAHTDNTIQLYRFIPEESEDLETMNTGPLNRLLIHWCTLLTHTSGITSMCWRDNKLITAGSDGVRVWLFPIDRMDAIAPNLLVTLPHSTQEKDQAEPSDGSGQVWMSFDEDRLYTLLDTGHVRIYSFAHQFQLNLQRLP